MTKRKLRHGQQIITYRWTIYDQYKWGENYLHPEIIVQPATVRDPLAEYAKYPDDHYLERAKRIRACTSDTLYIDTSYGLSESFSVRFQTNRESGGDRGYHYPPCYGAKITDCGFDARTIAIAAKLAKQCNANWSIGVLDVVAALKEMKAQAVIWSKDADCLILCDRCLACRPIFDSLPKWSRRKQSRSNIRIASFAGAIRFWFYSLPPTYRGSMNATQEIERLIDTATSLAAANISGWDLDDNGNETNHWGASAEQMRRELDRFLTPEEITCLSLSRNYGRTPAITDSHLLDHLLTNLWPEGNHSGLRFDWKDLAERLADIATNGNLTK